MKRYRLSNQVVLITGGSQGLGKEFAKKYFRKSNSTIIIVARTTIKLKVAAGEITGGKRFSKLSSYPKNNARLYYHSADLSNRTAVQELFDILEEKGLKVTQAILCAGGAMPKTFSNLSLEELEMGVNTNYLSAAYVAHLTLKQGVDHVVFFSSSSGLYPFVGYGQYAPMKTAIRSLVSVLRQEYPDTRISCVYPGNFLSEGYEEENLNKPWITTSIEGRSTAITCDDCCNKIIKSLQGGYDDVITDMTGWMLLACNMGFNFHSYHYVLWPIGWVLGCVMNLLVVPLYMLITNHSISRWNKQQDRASIEKRGT